MTLDPGSAPTNDHDRLHHIRDKLDRLRRDGWKQHAHQFRVEAHRFLLSPPLDEGQVQAFESEHGIRLPADYRAFLRSVGEAGAGPYYGLLPLARWDDLADRPAGHLAQPSPLVPGCRYGDDWDEQLAIADSPFRGLLPLAEIGCGGYCLLVVSGPAQGRVVYAGDAPPYFVWDRSFLAWYERWLDELLAGVSTSWFGLTRGGSEAELLADFAVSLRPDERAEILASLGRMSPITSQAHPTLVAAGRDADPMVRAAALHAMAKAGHGFVDALVQGLCDPVASVRQAAVFALSALAAVPAQVTAIEAALARETDPSALFSLAHALEKAGLLHAALLRPHLDSPDPGVQRYADYFLSQAKRRPAPGRSGDVRGAAAPTAQAAAERQPSPRRWWSRWFGGPERSDAADQADSATEPPTDDASQGRARR